MGLAGIRPLRSRRAQLDGCRAGFGANEILCKPQLPGRPILCKIRAIDHSLETSTPGPDGAHRNGPIVELNESSRILEESPIPAPGFDAPRPHEEPALHHNPPDADEPVPRTCPDADGLA